MTIKALTYLTIIMFSTITAYALILGWTITATLSTIFGFIILLYRQEDKIIRKIVDDLL
jgi:hypothetical protein